MAKAKKSLTNFVNHFKKSKIYYLNIFIAVICVTAFFGHENFVYQINEVQEVESVWKTHKTKRTETLEVLKQKMTGTPEYENYWEQKLATDAAYDQYVSVFNSQKFMGFKNFQQFMGEFGVWFAIFIYSLFNLILTFVRKIKNFFADAVLHITIITVSVFYLRWCFNTSDYLSSKYIIFNIITVLMVSTSVFLYTKYRQILKKRIENHQEESKVFIDATRTLISDLQQSTQPIHTK